MKREPTPQQRHIRRVAHRVAGLSASDRRAIVERERAVAEQRIAAAEAKRQRKNIKRIIASGGNVRAFGAVGDGVTDDTAAIQRAVDAMTSLGTNRPAVIPRGEFAVREYAAGHGP